MGCLVCKPAPLGVGATIHPTGQIAPAEAWLCADEDDYDAFLMTSSRRGPEPPPPYSEIAQEGHISVSHAAPADHRLGQSFNTSEADILNQSMRSTVSLPLNIHDRVAALELLLQGERTRANNIAIEAAAPPARVVPHSLSLPPSLQRPSTQPLPPLPPCPPLLRRSSSRHSCHSELPSISLQHLSHSQHYRVQRRTRRKRVKNRRRSQGISQSLRDDTDGQLTIRLSTNVSREGGRIAETVDERVEEIRDEVVDQAACSDAIVEDRTASTPITQQSSSDHKDEEQWPELEEEEERERQEEEGKERDRNKQSFNQLVTEQREEEDSPSDVETNNSNSDQSLRTDSSDQEEEEESKL